ncbi:MAG: hypothetical protein Q7S98_05955 [Deltaproteobacteria bacterium]|nr:hypothetical protein [Deltaproteobacteria bacterium]
MKQTTKGALAVIALLSMTAASAPVWAFGNVNTNFNFNNSKDHSLKSGRDMVTHSNSHNKTTTTTNRNDNRTDNRDYSNRSSTVDSRNMSDNRNFSDNRVDNQRHQSHNLGDNSILVSGGYQPKIGHESVSQGAISGENNYVDNSVSGYFGIGHTSNTTK